MLKCKLVNKSPISVRNQKISLFGTQYRSHPKTGVHLFTTRQLLIRTVGLEAGCRLLGWHGEYRISDIPGIKLLGHVAVFRFSLDGTGRSKLLKRLPRVFREQGNMALKLLGTREQKENKARNTGTKAVLREQGTTKSKKYF